MSEKKIFSIDVAMDEPMFLAIKRLAEVERTTAPELIRTLISTLIDDRRAYYASLDSIFGQPGAGRNAKRTGSDPAIPKA